MTPSRFNELMETEKPLTQEEILAGWHFCPEMDGLLANSNDPEGDCFCSLNTHRS